jgi:hypothetical protein
MGVAGTSFLIKLDDSMKNKYRDCGLEVPTGYKIPGTRTSGERIIQIGRINNFFSSPSHNLCVDFIIRGNALLSC